MRNIWYVIYCNMWRVQLMFRLGSQRNPFVTLAIPLKRSTQSKSWDGVNFFKFFNTDQPFNFKLIILWLHIYDIWLQHISTIQSKVVWSLFSIMKLGAPLALSLQRLWHARWHSRPNVTSNRYHGGGQGTFKRQPPSKYVQHWTSWWLWWCYCSGIQPKYSTNGRPK